LNLYTAILFVHAISVLVITAALTMEAWMLFQLRRTVHPDDAQSLTPIVPLIGISAIGSLVIIYATGAYLTESLNSWEFAWPRFAVGEILLYALFGALTGKQLRKISRYSTPDNKSHQSEWISLTRSSFLKISLSTRIWIVLGTILLTAAKPPLLESLAIVGGSLICGFAFSLVSFPQKATSGTEIRSR
jgi:hypothetical protein